MRLRTVGCSALWAWLLVLGCAGRALAQPVAIDPSLAAAPPRQDPGTGACASSVWVGTYNGVNGYFDGRGVDEAIRLLDLDPVVLPVTARYTELVKAVNFKNDYPGSDGEFPGAVNNKVYFPFSDSPLATPGGNDRNFALRVRGYVNIVSPGIVTYSIYGDDYASLSIAGQDVTVAQVGVFALMTRQVQYTQPGLYPLEIVYFQNGSAAILELGEAQGAQTEGAVMDFNAYLQVYRLVQPGELFSAAVGQSACQECQTDADLSCRPANYCRDGLCQPCVTSQFCGASCSPCAATTPICYTASTGGGAGAAAACVECLKDSDCSGGVTCDLQTHLCNRPACTSDADCPQSERCDLGAKVCRAIACAADGSCPGGLLCDPARSICVEAAYTGGGCGAASSGAPRTGGGVPLAGAGALGLFGLWAVAWRRRARRSAALLGLFFCTLAGERAAHAQQAAPISLNAQTFQPALGPGNILTVESSATPGKTTFLGGVVFEYAHLPLRLVAQDNGNTLSQTVPDMFTAHIQAGLGIWRIFTLGLSLPVVLYQGFGGGTPTADVPSAPPVAGVGDLRFLGKVRILNSNGGGFGLAFVPALTVPTGSGQDLRGADAVQIEGRLAADYRLRGGFLLAANLGFLGRTSDQIARETKISHQVRYGLGALLPLGEEWALWGELAGGTSISSVPGGPVYSPIEGYLGGRYVHRSGMNLNLGLGSGFNPAVGSPQVRLVFSMSYLPWRKGSDLDPDLDGVLGAADDCPDEPGAAALRGCPDADGDGITDRLDRCPRVPGPKENQGCPDQDGDGDGVVDRLDRCPAVPGPKENQGCPDQDGDGDGVVDRLDHCPAVAGPRDHDGCPEPDADRDGIPDRLDKCPTVAGPPPTGCPQKRFLYVTQDKIELKQKVFFATGRARILPASYELLNEVAEVLRERPTMTLRIEGHTDARGSLRLNTRLSRSRARSVQKYLELAGIARERLIAEGYGPTRPIGDNRTAVGREKNRRTEFFILTQ